MTILRNNRFWLYIFIAAASASLTAYSISLIANRNSLPEAQIKIVGPQFNTPSGPRVKDLVSPLKNATRP